MPDYTVSVYDSNKVSDELLDKLKGISLGLSGRPLSSSDNSLLITSSHGDEIMGFCDIKLKDDITFIRNIVIHPEMQQQGQGLTLLRAAVKESVERKTRKLQLACKSMHIAFFNKGGFVTTEAPDSRNMSEYYLMENPCPNVFLKSNELNPENSSRRLRLSEDTELYRFSTENDYVELHASQLLQARKNIWLLFDSINNPVLSSEHTAQSLLKLVRRNPKSSIRLLLADDKTGAGYFNPTIAMAQRLSSYVEIRTLQSTGIPFKEAITLVDYSGTIVRQGQQNYQGSAYFNNRLLSKRLRSEFEQQWHYSKPSAHHKRLAL